MHRKSRFIGRAHDHDLATRAGWGSPFSPIFTPLPHFDWDLTGISLPPYPEGLGALYRHVIEGGRRRKGGGERGQKRAKNPTPLPPKILFWVGKNLPPYTPKTVTKLMYPPYPSIDIEGLAFATNVYSPGLFQVWLWYIRGNHGKECENVKKTTTRFINTNLCPILSFDGYHLLSVRRKERERKKVFKSYDALVVLRSSYHCFSFTQKQGN